MNPPNKEDDATGVADTLQQLAAQIHGIYQPQLNARADLLKTIVSVSSGAIVLSVTFSSSLRTLKLGGNWGRLLVLAFILLIFSLVIGLVALWIGTRVYGIQSDVFNARVDIRQAFMAATSQEGCLSALKQIHSQIIERIESADRRVAYLLPVSSIAFCLAIICLAIVGAKEILY